MDTLSTAVEEQAEQARARAELEVALADALRRASSRAEHIRLVHIQSLMAVVLRP